MQHFIKFFFRQLRDQSDKLPLGALNHAKVMLRRTHHTIAGISNAMGFSQDSAFSKFFKRIAGISPQQYRQQHNLHM